MYVYGIVAALAFLGVFDNACPCIMVANFLVLENAAA